MEMNTYCEHLKSGTNGLLYGCSSRSIDTLVHTRFFNKTGVLLFYYDSSLKMDFNISHKP